MDVSPETRRRGVNVATAVAVVVATLIGSLTLLITWQGYSALPLWDEWATVSEAERLFAGNFTLADLTRPHNEHRIAISRVVFMADYLGFGATKVPSLVVVWLLHLSLVALLTAMVRDAAALGRGPTLLVAALVTAVLFQPRNVENLGWSFQHAFAAVYVFGALALYAARRLTQATEVPHPAAARRLSWALICWTSGVAAAFSMGNGLLALPLVALWAIWFRAPAWFTSGTVTVLVLTLAAWLPGFALGARPGHVETNVASVLRALSYFCGVMGSPLSVGRLPWLAIASGAIGVVLCLIVAARLVTPRSGSQSQALLLATLAYAVASAGLVAVGRSSYDLFSALTGRYLVISVIAWTCLLALIWTMRSSLAGARQTWVSATLAVLVLAALGSAVGATAGARRDFLELAYVNRVAEAMVLSAVTDDTVSKRVRAWPKESKRHLDFLREHRLSVYRRGLHDWIGSDLALRTVLASGQPAPCAGRIDEVVPVHGSGDHLPLNGWSWKPIELRTGEFRVRGRAWHKGGQAAPERIVVTDEAQRVLGFGAVQPQPLGGILASVVSARNVPVEWEAFARITSRDRLRAYVLLDDGHTACLLAESAVIEPRRTPIPARPGAIVGNIDGFYVGERSFPVTEVATGNVGAGVRVSGWAVDASAGAPASAVVLMVDGRDAVAAGYGFDRIDVVRAFGGDTFRNTGWAVQLPSGLATAGQHEITVRVVTRDGGAYIDLSPRLRVNIQ